MVCRKKKEYQGQGNDRIGLSFLICAMSILMLPKEFDITQNPISQAVTTGVVILNMLIWYAAQKKLSGSLILSDEDVDEAEIREKYKYVVKGNREKERLKYSIIGCIFGVTAILLGNTVGMTAAGAAGAAAIWMLTQEKRKYKHARKRVLREVEKQFRNG